MSDMSTNITMNLTVRPLRNIKLSNTSDFYEIGKRYQLDCIAKGYPNSCGCVRWRWYSCPSPQNCSPTDNSEWIDINETNINSSLLLLSNRELIIRPGISTSYQNLVSLQVVANQSGVYRCYAINENNISIYNQTAFIVTGTVCFVVYVKHFFCNFNLVFSYLSNFFYFVDINLVHKTYF